jgi:hypothetical protein
MFWWTSPAPGAMPSAPCQEPYGALSPVTEPAVCVPCDDSSYMFGPVLPKSKYATIFRWPVPLFWTASILAGWVPGVTCV